MFSAVSVYEVGQKCVTLGVCLLHMLVMLAFSSRTGPLVSTTLPTVNVMNVCVGNRCCSYSLYLQNVAVAGVVVCLPLRRSLCISQSWPVCVLVVLALCRLTIGSASGACNRELFMCVCQ